MIEMPFQYTKSKHKLSFKNTYLKVDHHTETKWFIRGSKHSRDNPLLILEQSC